MEPSAFHDRPLMPPSLVSTILALILSPMHRVYASFQHRKGWHVSFLESDLKTSLRKHLTFASDHKLIELAERGKADLNLESRAAIQHGIEIGRGGLYLNLSEEQYRKLL